MAKNSLNDDGKALEGFLKTLNKMLPGSAFLANDTSNPFTNVDVIPTGAISLDTALGCRRNS